MIHLLQKIDAKLENLIKIQNTAEKRKKASDKKVNAKFDELFTIVKENILPADYAQMKK